MLQRDLIILAQRALIIFHRNIQGWEFAHRFSERIARFLPKNEQMSDSLQKMSDSLIFGEQPELFAHGRDLLTLLIFAERPERFAHIAHQKRGNEQSLIF